MTNKKLKNLEEKLSNIQRKIDPDCIDSLQGHDSENFKNYKYDCADVYIWEGQLCISTDYAEYIMENTTNKTIKKDLNEAIQYGQNGIGYEHLILKRDRRLEDKIRNIEYEIDMIKTRQEIEKEKKEKYIAEEKERKVLGLTKLEYIDKKIKELCKTKQ